MNTAIINALIENPSVILHHFIVEPLAAAALAYYFVWLIMRPKDGRKIESSFFWHACGVTVTVIGSAIFRVIALATFAGYSAYDPPAEDGTMAFYLFVAPALIATGYFTLLKFFRILANTTEPEKHNGQVYSLSNFNPFRYMTETTRRISITLFSAFMLTWFAWVGFSSDGYSGLKPMAWLLIFGAPLSAYIVLLITLPTLRKVPKDVRFMVSASLMWAFMAGIWGFILLIDDRLSFEHIILFALTLIGAWLAFLLWRWTKAG